MNIGQYNHIVQKMHISLKKINLPAFIFQTKIKTGILHFNYEQFAIFVLFYLDSAHAYNRKGIAKFDTDYIKCCVAREKNAMPLFMISTCN